MSNSSGLRNVSKCGLTRSAGDLIMTTGGHGSSSIGGCYGRERLLLMCTTVPHSSAWQGGPPVLGTGSAFRSGWNGTFFHSDLNFPILTCGKIQTILSRGGRTPAATATGNQGGCFNYTFESSNHDVNTRKAITISVMSKVVG